MPAAGKPAGAAVVSCPGALVAYRPRSRARANSLNVVDWIVLERDGAELAAAQIRELIAQFMREQVTGHQMSARLMAVYFRILRAGLARP
jgi:Glycosyl transferase family, helical bundle domain